jgi:hypothetical protein
VTTRPGFLTVKKKKKRVRGKKKEEKKRLTVLYFGRTAMIVRFLRKTTDVTFEKSWDWEYVYRDSKKKKSTVLCHRLHTLFDDVWWRLPVSEERRRRRRRVRLFSTYAEDEGPVAKDDIWCPCLWRLFFKSLAAVVDRHVSEEWHSWDDRESRQRDILLHSKGKKAKGTKLRTTKTNKQTNRYTSSKCSRDTGINTCRVDHPVHACN